MINDHYKKLVETLNKLNYKLWGLDGIMDIYRHDNGSGVNFYIKKFYDVYKLECQLENFQAEFGLELGENGYVLAIANKGDSPESFFNRCIDMIYHINAVLMENPSKADQLVDQIDQLIIAKFKVNL